MTIQTGYAIASKSALKAPTASQRVDGYARLVKSVGWYMFDASSTATDDDDLVLMPNDSPSSGRWIKIGGAGSGGANFGGAIICNSGCAIGGKAFGFYAPQAALDLIIQPGFDINIQNTSNAIAIYRWSTEPNTGMTGKETSPIIQLPSAGGKFSLTINSTYKWISIFAKNPSNSNYLDGTCFVINGNVITLLGYS